MSKPVMLAVSGDPATLAALAAQLPRRFGADYDVVAESSPPHALGALQRLRAEGSRLALVVADQWLPGTTGTELLSRAHEAHPAAKRLLLITYGDRSVSLPIMRAMTLGQIDDFFGKPWGAPEERLYPMIGDLLSAWSRATAPSGLELVRVIGPRWSPRSHELRDILGRNAIPSGFYDTDSPAGRSLLDEAGQDHGVSPVLLLFDGRVLVDPPNEELAEALGVRTQPEAGHYDLTIVGAGPAGLAAAVYAASEGLRTLLLEREAVGGQAGTTSLIRNYLGFPRGISGTSLAARAAEQAHLFGAEFVYARQGQDLHAEGPDRIVTLGDGTRISSRAVVIATGVTYRRLDISGLDTLTGAGVFYGAAVTEAPAMTGQHVHVVGGANSAGQAAVHLAKYAAHVTLVVRGDRIAASMSDYLVKQIERTDNITVRLHTQVVAARGAGCLEELMLQDASTGTTEVVPATALFILIGAEPHTQWLARVLARDDPGFLLTGRDLQVPGTGSRWPLDRPPLPLETSLPGVFAAGDVRHGSIKRVASAVGEGAATVQLIHQYL